MVSTKEKALNLLGLAQKARRLVCGDFAAMTAVDNKKVTLLLLAEDASSKTVERYRQIAHESNVPLMVAFSKEELSGAVGKEGLVAVIALTDEGFSRSLKKTLESEHS